MILVVYNFRNITCKNKKETRLDVDVFDAAENGSGEFRAKRVPRAVLGLLTIWTILNILYNNSIEQNRRSRFFNAYLMGRMQRDPTQLARS